MILERAEISGFRGLAKLAVNFTDRTVLIGENAWGKSSLLRALLSVFGGGDHPYQFKTADFRTVIPGSLEDREGPVYRYQEGDPDHVVKSIVMVFTFRERTFGSALSNSNSRRLQPYWQQCSDMYTRIFYCVRGYLLEDGTVQTIHGFRSRTGSLMDGDASLQVRMLLLLNPLFRLRDSRTSGFTEPDIVRTEKRMNPPLGLDLEEDKRRFGGKNGRNNFEKLAGVLKRLFRNVMKGEGADLAPEFIDRAIDSMRQLVEHYFQVTSGGQVKYLKPQNRSLHDIVSRPIPNGSLASLQNLVSLADKKKAGFILALIAGALLSASQGRRLQIHAHPIVIFEDIDSRLHPVELFGFWNVVSMLPMQQIITTNSGDILSTVNLSDIRRMYSMPFETRCYCIDEKKFSSDELRKIAFHIRINRPMSLYARGWIFVEGETEIWLLNEFANIMGLNLLATGIRLVEYAQCGSGALIKLAQQLGLCWRLLAVGDLAGQKYTTSGPAGDNPDKVTMLPAVDIEHYLYENGFENVYRAESGYGNAEGIGPSKIIERALKRRTKPGMAVAVADYASHRGPKIIPKVIADVLKGIVEEASSSYNW